MPMGRIQIRLRIEHGLYLVLMMLWLYQMPDLSRLVRERWVRVVVVRRPTTIVYRPTFKGYLLGGALRIISAVRAKRT